MMPKPRCPLSSALQQQTQQPNQITCVNQSANHTATPKQQPTHYHGLDQELGQWTSVISMYVVDHQVQRLAHVSARHDAVSKLCLKSMALRQAVLPSSTLLTTGSLRTYVISMVLPCSAIQLGAICSCVALRVMPQKRLVCTSKD